jgi:hypothetical protein
VRRPHAVLLALLALVLLPCAAAQAAPKPPPVPPVVAPPLADPATAFDGDGMWIWQIEETEGGDLERIAARARSAGLSFVVVKAAHGTRWWPQFDRELVDTLHAAGVRVCAYQRALSRRPEPRRGRSPGPSASARTAWSSTPRPSTSAATPRRARTSARCAPRSATRSRRADELPVRRRAPQLPVRDLPRARRRAGQPPQMYWGLIGTTIGQTFARTWEANAAFGRPIRPIGQLFGGVRPAAVRAFRAQAAAHGAAGVSWWVWQHARPQDWREVRVASAGGGALAGDAHPRDRGEVAQAGHDRHRHGGDDEDLEHRARRGPKASSARIIVTCSAILALPSVPAGRRRPRGTPPGAGR